MTRATRTKTKAPAIPPIQIWTLGLPERVPLTLQWWWQAGVCQGGRQLALLDLHQAHYTVTDLLELRYLYEPHRDQLGTWRHIDYCSVACALCGQLLPIGRTAANRLERMYTYPALERQAPSALIDYHPYTSRPTSQEVHVWSTL